MLTQEERDAEIKAGFPDNVEGYVRPGNVPTDFPYDDDFPQFISRDEVVHILMNLVLRQLLSNDKHLKEDVDLLTKAKGLSHKLILKGDVTGEATFTNATDINVTTTAKNISKGMIVMWYGSAEEVPSGWSICNGENGTPDLRDRFVLGAGKSYSLNATGGEKTHTLTVSEIPEHKHIFPWGESWANWDPYGVATGKGYMGADSEDYDNYWGYTSPVGGSGAHNNMPPYMALYYIMKL